MARPKKTTESADLFAAFEDDPALKDSLDFKPSIKDLIHKEEPAASQSSKLHSQDSERENVPAAVQAPAAYSAVKRRGRLPKTAQNSSGQGKGSSSVKPKIVLADFVYPIDRTCSLVCGADEAGRGPLMGNVVAACVVLDLSNPIAGLNDSKKLTEKKREALELEIKSKALAWGIGQCTPQEIDAMNILQASLEAMRRAYFNMELECSLMLVDGNKVPPQLPLACEAVVKGDARVAEIAAASILAKVERDRQLYALDKQYPEYGFASHKGYPTKAHLEVLERLPILDCYRRSYRPVQKILKLRGEL